MPRKIDTTHADLIQKAQLLFWVKGFKAVSPEDLANHLNISISSIYNKYGKDMLFLEALESYVSSITDPSLKALRESLKGKEETFQDVFYPLVDALVDGDFPKSCLMVNVVVEVRNEIEGVNDIYENYFGNLRKSFEQSLERLYKLGEIELREKIPEYVDFLLGIAFGLSVLYKVKNREELRAHINEQISILK